MDNIHCIMVLNIKWIRTCTSSLRGTCSQGNTGSISIMTWCTNLSSLLNITPTWTHKYKYTHCVYLYFPGGSLQNFIEGGCVNCRRMSNAGAKVISEAVCVLMSSASGAVSAHKSSPSGEEEEEEEEKGGWGVTKLVRWAAELRCDYETWTMTETERSSFRVGTCEAATGVF